MKSRLGHLRPRHNFPLWLGFVLALCPPPSGADCTLTNLNIIPLPDLGLGRYQGFNGGLYPNGLNQRPPAHEQAGIDLAINAVLPRDGSGTVDTNNGRVVLLSIGMSNTTQEFSEFKRRADRDAGRNLRLIIVDGAQGGQDAVRWTNANAQAWSNVTVFLGNASLTSNQVQVLWIKQALAQPNRYGAFPAHAQALEDALETILRHAQRKFPNLKLAFLSSRTRAYVLGPQGLNPEPFAFEGAFATQWIIAKQLAGQLPFQAQPGPAIVPWLSWGPYLWTDGTRARSDGFVWLCSDLSTDFTHPSTTGRDKVALQLLAFFKTDPVTTPWFLRRTVTGQSPTCLPTANITNGLAPLSVQFNANATDPDGVVQEYLWTFEDGTFSTNANPAKLFPAPGIYRVRLTVTDNAGNPAQATLTIRAGTTLERWRQSQFSPAELANPAVSGDDTDPDQDQISNRKEYAAGFNPKFADPMGAAALTGALVDHHFQVSYPRNKLADDILFALETSADLEHWSAQPALFEFLGAQDLGATELATYRLAQDTTALTSAFVRLHCQFTQGTP